MAMTQDAQELAWNPRSEESPFTEFTLKAEDNRGAVGFAPWDESQSPFTVSIGEVTSESESDRLLAEAFAALRDEAFDEAVGYLAEETEQAVSDRFTNESPATAGERERYAEAQLSSVRFESEQYLDSLEAGLAGLDVASLTEEQLDEALDRFDPQTGELTPAGEEFIGSFIRKAKNAVKWAVKTAKNVGGSVVGTVGKFAGAALKQVLEKLKGLVNPLLQRVLGFAIGRLPAPLQAPARALASKIKLEAEEGEGYDEAPVSPANLTDVEALAESFDAALAEALTSDAVGSEGESFESFDNEGDLAGRQLETLAEARGALIDRIRSAGDEENLGPAIEQFVPALLSALRLGINLVGRPKVVDFLAKYLAQLISRWVGPALSGPLSNAIVDTGLRLITLEAENGEARDEAGPVALASVIEDTVRRMTENEDYVFENEDLMQLAASEAFSQAVATHFPTQFVRRDLQQAPSLSGTFVARRARSIRTYRKYSRVPEVDVTAQIADALPTFGGATVGAVMRAAGVTFPLKARMHIYQSAPGTTVPRMMRMDRNPQSGGRGYLSTANVHPLTSHAAGLLLREPKLGVHVPPAYLESRNRIAAGQRFYVLEPLGAVANLALPTGAGARSAAARLAPSRAWTRVDLRRGRITVEIYLSEAEAQGISNIIREGRGTPALLQALTQAYKAMEHSAAHRHGHIKTAHEDGEDFENLDARPGSLLPPALTGMLRKRLRAWILPALANWTKNNAETFARAAAHPDAGVTIRVKLTGVPGLDLLGKAAAAIRGGSVPTGILGALKGTPQIAITVTPGRGKGRKT